MRPTIVLSLLVALASCGLAQMQIDGETRNRGLYGGTPTILGPSSGTEGDSVAFSNSMFSAWSFGGGVTTNWCAYTATLSNGTVSPVTQTITLNNGFSTATKGITVNPIAPSANFSATPTSGAPPLSVVFTNLASGAYTNMYWYFGDPEWTSPSEYSGAPTNSISVTYSQVSVTSPYLLVRGYGNSLLTRTNYINVSSNANLYALVTDGTQNYAQTDPSQVFAPLSGNLRVSFWTYCDTLPSGQFAFMGTLTGGEGWTIQMTPSFEVYFDVFAQGSGDQYSPFVAAGMTTGVWTHISAAYSIDTGGVACWVNGVWTGPPPAGLTLYPTNSANFTIGARTALDTWFPGLIRDIRVESWDGSTNNFTPAWVQGSVGATAYFPMSSTNAAYVPESVGGVNANFFGIPIPAWTNAPSSFP